MDLSPLLCLRLTTPRLVLRLPRPEELAAFAEVARRGVHPPEEMPFLVAWTDRAADPDFAESFAAFHLGLRRAWSAERWTLELGVWHASEPVGLQALRAERFSERRRVDTGSWLGSAFQRGGLGTEMRAAALELAFAGLGAEVARSAYAEQNDGSRRVSEKLGYRAVGEVWASPRGVPVRHVEVELARASWHEADRPEVEIAGLGPCLPLFGVG